MTKPTLTISLKEPPFLYDYLLEQIAWLLEPEDVLNLRVTCKYFRNLVPQWNKLWFQFYALRHMRCLKERTEHKNTPILLTCLEYRKRSQWRTKMNISSDLRMRDIYREKEKYPLPNEDQVNKSLCRCPNHWTTKRIIPWDKYQLEENWFDRFLTYRRDQILAWHRKKYQDHQMIPAIEQKKKKAQKLLEACQRNIIELRTCLDVYDQVLEKIPEYQITHLDPVKVKKAKEAEKERKRRLAEANAILKGRKLPKPKVKKIPRQARPPRTRRAVLRSAWRRKWRERRENRSQLQKETRLEKVYIPY